MIRFRERQTTCRIYIQCSLEDVGIISDLTKSVTEFLDFKTDWNLSNVFVFFLPQTTTTKPCKNFITCEDNHNWIQLTYRPGICFYMCQRSNKIFVQCSGIYHEVTPFGIPTLQQYKNSFCFHLEIISAYRKWLQS